MPGEDPNFTFLVCTCGVSLGFDLAWNSSRTRSESNQELRGEVIRWVRSEERGGVLFCVVASCSRHIDLAGQDRPRRRGLWAVAK